MTNIGWRNVFREYIDACIEFVVVDCIGTFVSGARPCMVTYTVGYFNVWIAEMWEIWWVLKRYSIISFIFAHLFFFFWPEETSVPVSSGKRHTKLVDTSVLVTEMTIIRRMLTAKLKNVHAWGGIFGVRDSLFNIGRFLGIFSKVE